MGARNRSGLYHIKLANGRSWFKQAVDLEDAESHAELKAHEDETEVVRVVRV